MQITNQNDIEWTKKYYVVEGRSFYAGDTFTPQSIWTTKVEAIAEKWRTINLQPSDLRRGLRTRYRHRHLTEMEVHQMCTWELLYV